MRVKQSLLLSAGSSSAITVTFTSSSSSGSNLSTYTFNNLSIGEESSKRYIFVSFAGQGTGAFDVSGITMNGVAMVRISGQTNASCCCVIYRSANLVPTGTVANFIVSCTAPGDQVAFSVCSVEGFNPSKTMNIFNVSGALNFGTMTVPANGAIFAVGFTALGSGSSAINLTSLNIHSIARCTLHTTWSNDIQNLARTITFTSNRTLCGVLLRMS